MGSLHAGGIDHRSDSPVPARCQEGPQCHQQWHQKEELVTSYSKEKRWQSLPRTTTPIPTPTQMASVALPVALMRVPDRQPRNLALDRLSSPILRVQEAMDVVTCMITKTGPITTDTKTAGDPSNNPRSRALGHSLPGGWSRLSRRLIPQRNMSKITFALHALPLAPTNRWTSPPALRCPYLLQKAVRETDVFPLAALFSRL